MEQQLVEHITKLVLETLENMEFADSKVPVGISARHVHLSIQDLEALFGKNYALTMLKPLSQPGQFAAKEQVELIGPRGSLKNVRILGPTRSQSQVEISRQDARKLGVDAPVRGSGNVEGTPGLILKGPCGEVKLSKGVIVAERHLHMSTTEAERFSLIDGDVVQAFVEGEKAGIMGQIVVRVSPDYKLDLHIDTDDASAFNLMQGQRLSIEKC